MKNQANATNHAPITFILSAEFIEVCNLLKLVGLADSGGRGKAMVAQGLVSVDGVLETRKTAKIRVGQVVEAEGETIHVLANA